MHDRADPVSQQETLRGYRENPLAQNPVELASDLHLTEKQTVLGGRWEKGVRRTSETKIQERTTGSMVKEADKGSVIKWVNVLIKTEETCHRTVSLACLLKICKTELVFIHAQLCLSNNCV